MNYFLFLNREGKLFTKQFVGAATLAGLAEAFMVSMVVSASDFMRTQQLPLPYILQFVLCLLAYFFCRKSILDHGAGVIEELIGDLRKRVTAKLSNTDLRELEKIG